jgi:hypothetical protein
VQSRAAVLRVAIVSSWAGRKPPSCPGCPDEPSPDDRDDERRLLDLSATDVGGMMRDGDR